MLQKGERVERFEAWCTQGRQPRGVPGVNSARPWQFDQNGIVPRRKFMAWSPSEDHSYLIGPPRYRRKKTDI